MGKPKPVECWAVVGEFGLHTISCRKTYAQAVQWRGVFGPQSRVVHLVEQPSWLATMLEAWRGVPAVDRMLVIADIIKHLMVRKHQGRYTRALRIAAALLRAAERTEP